MTNKKLVSVGFFLVLLLIANPVFARDLPCTRASCIRTNTTDFDTNLSSADNTVQKALETIDEMAGGGGTTDDDVTVNGTAVDTTANFLDSIYGDFDIADGGAGGPDDITFTIEYGQTLAGNPDLAVDQCLPFADASGGGIICEGSTANTNEQLYRFPNVDGADTTEYFVVANDANVSSTEAGYLDGVTAAIADTDDKLSVFASTSSAELAGVLSDEDGTGDCGADKFCIGGHTHSAYAPLDSPTFTTKVTLNYATASELVSTNASKELVSLAVATYPSLTELSYVKGLSSAIQTQINAKAPSDNPTFTTAFTATGLVGDEDLQSEDFGDFTCAGEDACTLDAAVVDFAQFGTDIITGAEAVGTFTSGDTFLCMEAGVGVRECDYDDMPGGGGAEVNNLETVCTDIGADEVPVGTDTDTVVYKAIADCDGNGNALNYDTTGHAFSCKTLADADMPDSASVSNWVLTTSSFNTYGTSDIAHDTAGTGPLFDFRRERDGDPTQDVSSGDELGELRFRGYHTDGYYEGAAIRAETTADCGSSDMPSKLEFLTSSDASATPTLALTIDSSQNSAFAGTVTATGSFIIGSADMSETDLEKLDGITDGTATASKALVLDASGDIATINSLTATTLVGALTGNASTASALAADPANCASSGLAGGITAAGVAEACITPHAGTDITADLEEEVTEGSLADNTIVSDDIKNGTIIVADTAITAGRSLTWSTNDMVADAELYTHTKCIIIETPTSADNFLFYHVELGSQMTAGHCIVEAATSATISFEQCDVAGDNCTDMTSDIVCDVDGQADDGTIDAPDMDVDDWIRADVTATSGTPGHVTACISFTMDD